MKYLVLLTEEDHFARWDALDEAGRDRVFAEFRAFSAKVRSVGSIIAGDALVPPDQARTLSGRLDSGDRTVTDGPFAETVEQVGGFYYIELPDDVDVVQVAALLPSAYTVEVRPTVDVQV